VTLVYNQQQHKQYTFAMRWLVLVVAIALTIPTLAQDRRLHPDEAFFLKFSRNAAMNGDWMLTGALDKPPLTMYLNAINLSLFAIYADDNGVNQMGIKQAEFAGRALNTWMMWLLIAVTMRYSERVGTRRTGLYAGALFAFSPYMLTFAPTAFTDMTMLTFGMMSLWLASQGHITGAGIAMLCAIWSKQQAVFFIPLFVWYAYQHHKLIHAFSWLLIGLGTLWLWDTMRDGTSIFVQGTANNFAEKSLFASDLNERLSAWWSYLQWVFAHPLLSIVGLLGALLASFFTKSYRILVVWIIAYSAFHLFIDVNIYDRYVLLIVPMLCIGFALALNQMHIRLQIVAFSIFAIVMFISALMMNITSYPLGNPSNQHNGIDEVATYLNDKPVATVIYDRWLGWQLDFYLGMWTDKRRVYYPTPDALINGIQDLDEIGVRYFLTVPDMDTSEWIGALQNAEITIQQEIQINHVIIWRIDP